jgi:ankyrin repeat protein
LGLSSILIIYIFLIVDNCIKQIKGLTALMVATMKARLDVVELLIQKGADVNAQVSIL